MKSISECQEWLIHNCNAVIGADSTGELVCYGKLGEIDQWKIDYHNRRYFVSKIGIYGSGIEMLYVGDYCIDASDKDKKYIDAMNFVIKLCSSNK